jgi:SAV_6107-like HEPN
MGARPLMADQLPLPPALPAAAVTLLEQAHRGLSEATGCTDARQRYATAHLGARSAWVLLGQIAPELGEWATFFAAGAAKRAAAEAGLSHAVTDREADDLVRDVGAFLIVVENHLGAVPEPPRPTRPRVVGGTASEFRR